MPREVDHERRRQQVVKIATELVAKGGLKALTVRDVAKAAGYSTAIVSHYFEDKGDLLLSTYQAAVARAARRIATALKSDPSSLEGGLKAILPITPAQRRDWRLWVAFWGMAVAEPAFENEQRQRVNDALAVFEGIFTMRKARGLIAADADCNLLARQTISLINGLSIQALFDPAHWPLETQLATILSALEPQNQPRPAVNYPARRQRSIA